MGNLFPHFLYENLNKDCIKIALFTLFIEFTLQKIIINFINRHNGK